MQIKEDIIDNLNITHSTWQEEKRNRELLQEHIRTITDVVRKLNRDITVLPFSNESSIVYDISCGAISFSVLWTHFLAKVLENEIKQKDNVIGGTQSNVKALEMNHVAGLTDLRGRVARADASISRSDI